MIVRVDWEGLKQEIIGAYMVRGRTLRAIARDLGVSHTMVAVKLDEWGVQRRGRKRGRRVRSLVGRRYGRLRVVGLDAKCYPILWLVECDCGRRTSYTTSEVKTHRSCGCGPRGKARKRS